MLSLGVAALVAVLVGGVVGLAARRWPHLDPVAPSGPPVPVDASGRPAPSTGAEDAELERVTVLGLSAAALAVVASASIFGLLFVFVRSRAGVAEIDLGPARWAADQATPAAAVVLRVVTTLGSTAFALPLIAAVAALEHRRRPNRSILAFVLLVEGGQLLLVNLVKVLVGRARPDLGQLAGASSHSFPSGHAATAAATFAAVALLLGRRRRRQARAGLAGAAAGLTALVACSRVLLGVHWVTDVVAGAALGWGWVALCSVAFGGRRLHFGTPVRHAMDQADEGAPSGR